MARVYKFDDLTGRKFNRLFVDSLDCVIKGGDRKWNCICECGTKVSVTGGNLKNKKHPQTSCGCYFLEKNSEIHKKAPGHAAFVYKLNAYRKSARLRNLCFDLSESEVKMLFSGNCFYCGTEPGCFVQTKFKNGSILINGIDRLESEIGYSVGNVVSCCSTCNFAKLEMTKDEFLEWIERVHNHQASRL